MVVPLLTIRAPLAELVHHRYARRFDLYRLHCRRSGCSAVWSPFLDSLSQARSRSYLGGLRYELGNALI